MMMAIHCRRGDMEAAQEVMATRPAAVLLLAGMAKIPSWWLEGSRAGAGEFLSLFLWFSKRGRGGAIRSQDRVRAIFASVNTCQASFKASLFC